MPAPVNLVWIYTPSRAVCAVNLTVLSPFMRMRLYAPCLHGLLHGSLTLKKLVSSILCQDRLYYLKNSNLEFLKAYTPCVCGLLHGPLTLKFNFFN